MSDRQPHLRQMGRKRCLFVALLKIKTTFFDLCQSAREPHRAYRNLQGVVPTWLSSDALGGAVNIVTNRRRTTIWMPPTAADRRRFHDGYFSFLGRRERQVVGRWFLCPPEKVPTVMETWDAASAPPTNWRMGASSMCRTRNERYPHPDG